MNNRWTKHKVHAWKNELRTPIRRGPTPEDEFHIRCNTIYRLFMPVLLNKCGLHHTSQGSAVTSIMDRSVTLTPAAADAALRLTLGNNGTRPVRRISGPFVPRYL